MEELKQAKMFKLRKTAIIAGSLLLAVFLVAPVLAQQPALNLGLEYVDYTGLANTDIRMIIAKIIRVALGLLGLVALCFTIYGGYVYMTAGGNEEQITTAKKILKNMVIGLAIILSALSIVQFIIRAIYSEYAEKYGPGQEWPSGYNEDFVIGGFLGPVIESHYPGRNATDTPRNTKIVITFRQKIKPESLVVDSNGDGILGNLVSGISDQVNADNIKIYPTLQGETAALGTLPDTDVFAYLGEDGRTIVFKPKNSLGNDKEDVNYTVRLTNGVKLADGSDAFKGIGGYYSWSFTVTTKADLTPPQVESVIPLPATAPYPRNIIVQINFNEPVDPISASGIYQTEDINKNFQNITLAKAESELVSGEYKITNQYRTVEFKSADLCGANSCGQPVYCLPADSQLTSRVKTATLDPSNIPQAQITGNLYDGVVDLAGNVLNGGGELKYDNGKLVLTPGVLGESDWSTGVDKGGLNSGLVGWWGMDNSDITGTKVADKSGRGNNGTIVSHPSSVEGSFGQAFDFGNDSASYIRVPSSPSLDALLDNSFTFSLWFKANNWADWPENTYGELLVKGSGGYPGQGIYTGVSLETKQASLSWRCVPDVGLEFCNSLGSEATQEQRDSCACGLQLYSPALEDERWYNFAVTAEWDGAQTKVKLYLDGQLVSQDTKNKKTRNVSEAMKINLTSPYHFFGLIDEVRVYNRLLSAAEVKTLYENPPVAAKSVVFSDFWWKFSTSEDMDTTAPKLSFVSPGLQASNVSSDSHVYFTFDKLMSVGSFRDIILKTNKDFNVWYTPTSRQFTINNSEVKNITDVAHHTQAELWHGEFWKKPADSTEDEPEAIYYPFVPSTVTDILQNCFYPAVGPGPECQAGAGSDKLNETNPSCYDGEAKAGASLCGEGESCPFGAGLKP